jgi:hypothetical protein
LKSFQIKEADDGKGRREGVVFSCCELLEALAKVLHCLCLDPDQTQLYEELWLAKSYLEAKRKHKTSNSMLRLGQSCSQGVDCFSQI